MPTVSLPYDQGRALTLTIPERNYLGSADLSRHPAVADPAAEIRRALADPVESPRLVDLARGKKRIEIAVTDITRYCPDDLLVDAILGELASAGVPSSAITFVLALGSHRPMTPPEIRAKLGPRISDAYRILNHDWKDDWALATVGTEEGFPIQVNREIVEADLRLATGVIEPHLFAGYSGGAKTMVIGAGGHATIAATHGYAVLSHDSSRLGNADSIFRRFINRAGERVGVDFVVNLVVDPDKRLIRAFAGRPAAVYAAGVRFARSVFEVLAPAVADIVISLPGSPKNLNLYQATRAAYPAILGPRPVVRAGGIVIIPAPCPDGVGEETSRVWMRDTPDGKSIVEKARREGIPEGTHMAYRFGRFLTHASEIIVTDCQIPGPMIREVRLTPMATVQEALAYALATLGRDARVLVIPHGVAAIPVLPS
ncbi:MAG: nickel-dependent lactate racemase [Candidatus Rokubacteria bacterium]|nr:nickel-dependent lactate racemase [Candidatus Rokubacteria bacterium]